MPLFITSPTNRHGVFARSVNPPAQARRSSNGVVGIAGQFPWGPKDTLVTITNPADLYRTFAPPGFTQTGSAMTGLSNFGFPTLKVVRVLGTASAAATANVAKVGPVTILTWTAKYHGLAGNSMTVTAAAASDGDANHANYTVTMTNAFGTTSEVYRNINVSGVGTQLLPDVTNSALIATVTTPATGIPILGSNAFSGGADGTIDAAAYSGTAGTGNKGIALLESDPLIRHIMTDDPGNTLRAGCNAALKTQAETLGDRVAHISYNSGTLAVATVQADALTYVSENVVYSDVWANVYDMTRVLSLIPPHFASACLASNLSPSTPFSWRDNTARKFLGGIQSLEFSRASDAGNNTDLGICTLIPYAGGGFAFESSVVTINRTTPSKGDCTRTQMLVYIAYAALAGLQAYVDAPNVKVNQDDATAVVDGILSGLKSEALQNPNNKPFIVDYQIIPRATMNSQADIDAGVFSIGSNVKFASGMGQIIYQIQGGKTVNISVS